MNKQKNYFEAQGAIEKKYQTSQRQLFKTLGFYLEKLDYCIKTYKEKK